MNIRSINPPGIQAIESRLRTDEKKDVRLKDSADRDPSGRQEGDAPPERRPLTEEEWHQVIEKLKAVPGVISNHLSVEIEIKDGVRVLFLKSPDGVTVRRFSEVQVHEILKNLDRSTGQIFDKAM